MPFLDMLCVIRSALKNLFTKPLKFVLERMDIHNKF